MAALVRSQPAGGWENQFWPLHPEQSWEQFQQRMVEYVAGGYAFDLEDNEPSIRCVAAPIRDASKRIVAGISIASTVPYMPLEKMAELIPLIKGGYGPDSRRQLGAQNLTICGHPCGRRPARESDSSTSIWVSI